MPITNPLTGSTNTGNLALAQAAYDRLARFALRPELYFDQVADIKPTNQSMPGSSVSFPIVSDLAIASSALNESTDVTPQSISESNVTVTLAEYGNAVLTTAALRGESYVEIDPIVANVVGYNAGVSIDEVARNVLQAGSNVAYATGVAGRSAINSTRRGCPRRQGSPPLAERPELLGLLHGVHPPERRLRLHLGDRFGFVA